MYTPIKISNLPSRGVYYKKDLYIEARPLDPFETDQINNIKGESFLDQLMKLEIAMTSLVINMDEQDICYVDAYYIYFIIYGLTNGDVIVNYNNKEILAPINPEDFLYNSPSFKKKEDLYFKELDLTFYLPSIYNMLKANKNAITEGIKNSDLINNKPMLERIALVPYLQQGKISDDALDFVNEHMLSFKDSEILKIRNFININENYIKCQVFKVIENGEEVEIGINLSQLL